MKNLKNWFYMVLSWSWSKHIQAMYNMFKRTMLPWKEILNTTIYYWQTYLVSYNNEIYTDLTWWTYAYALLYILKYFKSKSCLSPCCTSPTRKIAKYPWTPNRTERICQCPLPPVSCRTAWYTQFWSKDKRFRIRPTLGRGVDVGWWMVGIGLSRHLESR